MIPDEWQNVPAPHEVKAWKSDSRVIVLFQTIWHISSSPGIVFGITSGSILSQEKKKKANISVCLTLKTSVYHRCKFSASISKCSTHKFSVKINRVHLKKKKRIKKKKHIKMGVIVFDIQCFNWDQAAELPSSVLMAPWFPSVKRGFLSDILRNTRFPFRGKPNRETRHCFALASCSIGISFFSTCNGHWVKGSRSFYLPLMRFCA